MNTLKINYKNFIFLIAGCLIFFYQIFKLIRINLFGINVSGYFILAILLIVSYVAGILIFKKEKNIIFKTGIIITAFLLFEIILNLLKFNIPYHNLKYFLTIILNVPIFIIFFSLIIKYKEDFLKLVLNVLTTYVFLLCFILIACLIVSPFDIFSLIKLLLSPSTFLHSPGNESYIISQLFNFEYYLFKTEFHQELNLGGSQKALYPFIYIMCFLSFPKYIKINNLNKIAFNLSLLIVFIFNSRAMLISLTLFGLIYVLKNKSQLIKLTISPFFLFPFYLLFLSNKEILRGREWLQEIFISSLTFWGNGIGKSIEDVKNTFILFGQRGIGSYHNIHYEFIHNFGLIIYFLLILVFTISFFKSKKAITTLAYYAIFTFVFMGLGFNLFDFIYILISSLFLGLFYLEEKSLIKQIS